jgi:hypothetical protein
MQFTVEQALADSFRQAQIAGQPVAVQAASPP